MRSTIKLSLLGRLGIIDLEMIFFHKLTMCRVHDLIILDRLY
jgi:hypothetical protein